MASIPILQVPAWWWYVSQVCRTHSIRSARVFAFGHTGRLRHLAKAGLSNISIETSSEWTRVLRSAGSLR